MHSIGFLLRVTKPEWKSALKIPSYYDFLQNKGSVCCTSAECTAAGGEIQVPRVGIYEWRRLLKQTQFCVTLSLCGHKTGSFKHCKAVSFLIGFCSDPHLWFWILGNDRDNITSGASGRDGIFAKSPWCDTFTTKCAAVKLAESWMSNHFSELRTHRYIGSAICPEFPSKDWRGNFCCC